MDAADSTGREITDTGYVDRRPVDAGTGVGNECSFSEKCCAFTKNGSISAR